jgi:hypothetical protein
VTIKRLKLPTDIEIGSKTISYCTEEEMIKKPEYKVDDLKDEELKILHNLKTEDHEETVGSSKSLS